MCSIIGSYDKNTIKDLVSINQHRGNFSYSITTPDDSIKEFGPFNTNKLDDLQTSEYILCHVQAPTGGLIQDANRIHPVNINQTKLWHNGILVQRQINKLQKELDIDSSFDTYLMCNKLYQSDDWINELSNIEGLFACVYFRDNDYYIFRTKHGKLYVNSELDISSERFDGSKCINYDTVYKLDFDNLSLIEYGHFKTNRCNIIINGEM